MPSFFWGDDEEAGKGCEEWVCFFVCLFGGFCFGFGFFWGWGLFCFLLVVVVVVVVMMILIILFCIFFLWKKIEASLPRVKQQLDINDRQNHHFLSPLFLR